MYKVYKVLLPSRPQTSYPTTVGFIGIRPEKQQYVLNSTPSTQAPTGPPLDCSTFGPPRVSRPLGCFGSLSGSQQDCLVPNRGVG